MTTIDLRKTTTASTGQQITYMNSNEPNQIDSVDSITLRLNAQDAKIDKILKILESK
tara:strand:+ start:490 stop:660 length:171 start_codon:yes stop_codon:yes gene_type:complete